MPPAFIRGARNNSVEVSRNGGMENQKNIFHILTTRRIGVMLPLAFASGLPLALTHDTLRQWLNHEHVPLTTIGLIGLVGLPYTLKFLWAPFMDRFVPPWLGRRRGWMFVTQMCLMAGIVSMAITGPGNSILLFGFLAFLLSFVSASQDIAFDAYRTDVLSPPERGFGAAITVTTYRIAMLVSGGFALFLADQYGFSWTYLIMAFLMVVGLLGTFLSPDPDTPPSAPNTLRQAYEGPMREFFSRSYAVWLLVLVVLYKLGDAFAGFFTGVFLEQVGFSLSEIGAVYKGMGLGATLLGALAGGGLMVRMGLFHSLLVFGVLQAISNLSFLLLALTGKSYPLMVGAVAFENFSGGMGTAAFVAFLMSLCDSRYTAAQYALLSALAAFGREFVGPPSGYLVEAFGWATFFILTFLSALPGLILLMFLKKRIPCFSPKEKDQPGTN